MIKLNADCPICDANINLADDVEESEIIVCAECENRVVVEKVNNPKVILAEAPEIEEDWGQ